MSLPARLVRACARVVVPMAAAIGCAASVAAQSLVPGATVTYREASGQTWCATIWSIEIGVAGVPIAWLTFTADPRRIVQADLAALTPGCAR